jgi:hypothetical protein
MLLVSYQLDQPPVGLFEPTPVEIERTQRVVEVDMEPFASSLASLVHADFDHLCGYPSMAIAIRHQRVQYERMERTVPSDIYESD